MHISNLLHESNQVKKKLIYIVLFDLLILLFSCQQNKNENISVFKVQRVDFVDAVTVEGFVEPVKSITVSCPQGIDGTVLWLADDGTIVNEGDEICILEDKNTSSEYDEAVRSLEDAQANLEKVRANHQMQLAMLEAQIKTNNAETLIAGLDSLQLKYSSDNQRKIKELELQRTAIEKSRYDKKMGALHQIQQSELRGLQIQMMSVQMRVERSKKKLESLIIKAPQSGMVVIAKSMMTAKKLIPSDNVWEGLPVCTMPELKKMKVIIMASESNYKRIQLDDKLEYSFDAMPANSAYGRITKKAPVGKPVAKDSKVKLFEIEASVDSFIQIPGPGFSAECRVILKQVPDTLLVPQIAVFEQDSMKVVFVQQKNGFELRQIKTGISSTKEVIVSEGLKTNERIALTKPPLDLIKWHKLLPDSTVKTLNKRKSEIK